MCGEQSDQRATMYYHLAGGCYNNITCGKEGYGAHHIGLDNRFGKESHLTTMHRKVLEYFGMTLDYTSQGKVKM